MSASGLIGQLSQTSARGRPEPRPCSSREASVWRPKVGFALYILRNVSAVSGTSRRCGKLQYRVWLTSEFHLRVRVRNNLTHSQCRLGHWQPLVVRRIVPPSPTASPLVAEWKCTPSSRSWTSGQPSSHVAPASVSMTSPAGCRTLSSGLVSICPALHRLGLLLCRVGRAGRRKRGGKPTKAMKIRIGRSR